MIKKPVPQDLIDMINWAVENDLTFIELLACEDAGCYDAEEWKKIIATENCLPWYDIDDLI